MSQGGFNESIGLPRSWTPPEYLGKERGGEKKTKTPGGIKVLTHGFDREDIPLMRGGIKARVILADIDAVWQRVRAEMLAQTYARSEKLTPKQVKKTQKVPPPIVDIWSTLAYWEGAGYIGGLMRGPVGVTVWYETVTKPKGIITNWEQYLYHEFGHYIYASIIVGRVDLSELLDGRV